MIMITSLKKPAGFTIVEALVGFLVIALGALAVATLMNRSLEMNADAEARTEALHLAKETISEFRDFATKDEVLAYATDSVGNTMTGNNAVFTRTWTVADVTGNSNAVQLSVNVAWTGVNGTQNISLTSQIAKVEPQTTGEFLLALDAPVGTVVTTTTSCLCTWSGTNSGRCPSEAASAVPSDSTSSCCTIAACAAYSPSTKECKKKPYSLNFTCS